MKVKLIDIEWDTDGIDPKELELPDEMVVELDDEEEYEEEWQMADDAIDVATDKTGWCIKGAYTEILK